MAALSVASVTPTQTEPGAPPSDNRYPATEKPLSTVLGERLPCFGSRFPRGKPDSGAIIEGAGAAPGRGTARTRLNFSTCLPTSGNQPVPR